MRYKREEERRKRLEEKLIEISTKMFENNPPIGIQSRKLALIIKGGKREESPIRKTKNIRINSNENKKVNNNKNIKDNIVKHKLDEIKLPLLSSKQKKSSILTIKDISHIDTNQTNDLNIINNVNKSVNKSKSEINDTSFRSIKKSPYYFNDPKLSRLMDLKNQFKYKYGYHLDTTNFMEGMDYSTSINIISEGNLNKSSEREILN
jgi:hypothetical protein